MTKLTLFGLVLIFLLAAMPAADAMLAPGKIQGGVATKITPFKYSDTNTGETYVVLLLNITIKNNRPIAALNFNVYDKQNNLQSSFSQKFKTGGTYSFKNGPTFTVLRIGPARCLPRTNKCSEDAVMLSVT